MEKVRIEIGSIFSFYGGFRGKGKWQELRELARKGTHFRTWAEKKVRNKKNCGQKEVKRV